MVIDLEYETFSELFHCDIRAIHSHDYARVLTCNLIQYSNEIERLLDTGLYVRDYFSQVIMLLPDHISLADALLEHTDDIIIPDIIYASYKAQPGLSILTDIFPFVEYKLFNSISEMEKEVLYINAQKRLGQQGSGNNFSNRVVIHTFRPFTICAGYVAK